jgi:hypothetical protein
MVLTEIQKQTTAQRLKDGIAVQAIVAEVGVDKRTVLLAEQKIKPLLKKRCLHNSNFNFGSVVLSSVYKFFFSSAVVCTEVCLVAYIYLSV